MKKRYTLLVVAIIACLLVAFTIYFALYMMNPDNHKSEIVVSGTLLKSVTYNGEVRQYYMYMPDDLPQDAPLVIAMHGYTGSAKDFMKYSGWNETADKYKFVVCYPQGTNDVYYNQPHFNARIVYSLTDDVGFISDLALDIADTYSVDSNRIYATGFSNGGYMSYTLACERPDVFRAIAPVSALMSEFTYHSYNPYNLGPDEWLDNPVNTPIPVCHIHGMADELIHPDGSMRDAEIYRIWGGGPSSGDTIEFWAGINECSEITVEEITDNVTKTVYLNPKTDDEVWYITVDNMPHIYPNRAKDGMDITASEIIWEFFSLYN